MLTTWLDLFPSRVLHSSNRFEKDQALFRNRKIDPADTDLAGDPLIVPGWVVPEQTQSETILASRSAVTGTCVAPDLGQHRHHISFKTDRSGLL